MRIMTILGTRPEIIRLSRIIALLDEHAEHVLVHTGQNTHHKLSGVFFEELGVRDADIYLGVEAPSFGEQIGQILARTERILRERRPDRLLILGDTNSGLSAFVACRMGIPVFHMEAGNRCFDDRVPEEVNRRTIDHSSSVLMPYTEGSRRNLLAEGISGERILVTGNPIKQVIDSYAERIAASDALARLDLERKKYFLVTMHRAENVDEPPILLRLVDALTRLHATYSLPVVCSVHPRTSAKAKQFGIPLERPGFRVLEPLGFFDFVRLEQEAYCVLSDSGTVQEEACIFGVPNVTLRDVTERPETVECGSNFLAGTEPARILAGVSLTTRCAPRWAPPQEYLASNVAETVCRIVLGHRIPSLSERGWLARQSLGAPAPSASR